MGDFGPVLASPEEGGREDDTGGEGRKIRAFGGYVITAVLITVENYLHTQHIYLLVLIFTPHILSTHCTNHSHIPSHYSHPSQYTPHILHRLWYVSRATHT